MEKIVLTEQEQKIIKAQLRGAYNPFVASVEDGKAYNHVIELAMAACTNIEETGGDLLKWFWEQYQNQQKAEKEAGEESEKEA